MSNNHPLIVRVKRLRSQEPSNSICIVEDSGDHESSPKSKRFAIDKSKNEMVDMFTSLSTSSGVSLNDSSINNSLKRKKVILTRVNTTSTNNVTDIINTHHETIKTSDIIDHHYVYSSSSSIWIPKGKKLLRSNSSSAVLVVDIHQQQLSLNHSNSPLTNTDSNNRNQYDDLYVYHQDSTSSLDIKLSPVIIKVYDPATRMMDEGKTSRSRRLLSQYSMSIYIAIDKAWNVGDFNGIANALIRGAHVDFQRDLTRHHGHTALMAAVKHCNLRMTTRLLEKGTQSVY